MASDAGARPHQRDIWWVALTIVFLAALAVRLYGIDWDDGTDLHPDELFITKFVLSRPHPVRLAADLGQLLDPAREPAQPPLRGPAHRGVSRVRLRGVAALGHRCRRPGDCRG